MSDLPANPPGWEESDRLYADVRREYLAAIENWKAATGWPERSERRGPEWDRVVEIRNQRRVLAEAARPEAPKALLEGLDSLAGDSIEWAIAWLEADPFTWRTGYLKQKVMGRLCRAPMTATQQDRLRSVLLRLTTRGPRQEFRDACRLARHVDNVEFRARLRALAARPEPHIAYAAGRMLQACTTKRQSTE